MKVVVLIGRILFSLIFLTSAAGHFSQASIGYAASQGIPMASFLVPASGIIEALGALSIILGYKVRLGAWLIVLFLLPVTIALHPFWNVADPMMKQMQMVMFLKNLSMMGAALLIAYFGAGPISLDRKIGSLNQQA